jgi:hypothetical protein
MSGILFSLILTVGAYYTKNLSKKSTIDITNKFFGGIGGFECPSTANAVFEGLASRENAVLEGLVKCKSPGCSKLRAAFPKVSGM